jgi:hypothetical protein
MIYGLNLADDGRILSACVVLGWHDGEDVPKTYNGMPVVEMLPNSDISDYRYVNDTYVHDPKPKPEDPDPKPTQLERIKALENQNETLLQCILEMSEIVYA